MGYGQDQLRAKALLALEEAVQETRYRTPRRTFALRFALAYLWTCAPRDRQPFDVLWQRLGAEKTPWSFSGADRALLSIYVALGLTRDDKVAQQMWETLDAEEQG